MSFVKYRLKEVAADFGVAPKEISDIISKFYEKPKSNTQVLNDNELNAVFDYMTQKNQIASIDQVFAVKATAPKQEAPKAAAPQGQNRPQGLQKVFQKEFAVFSPGKKADAPEDPVQIVGFSKDPVKQLLDPAVQLLQALQKVPCGALLKKTPELFLSL